MASQEKLDKTGYSEDGGGIVLDNFFQIHKATQNKP